MSPFGRLAALLSRFRREEKATAAVEFALIMPFLISLYFGSMEAAALFTADKRVNSISATVGDLVSQWDPNDGPLQTTTLNDYFAASTGLINPYPTANVKIVITLIEVKSDGTTKVLWSKGYNGGVAKVAPNAYSALTSGSMMNQVARGGCIVAAETSYSYKPVLGVIFNTALNLAHTNYFLPRFGSSVSISPQFSPIAANACTA